MNYLLKEENQIFLLFLSRNHISKYQKTTHFSITKISNERELEQIAYNHLSDIHSKGFINLYKKCIAKPCSFLVIDVAFASDNPLCFRDNLLERI